MHILRWLCLLLLFCFSSCQPQYQRTEQQLCIWEILTTYGAMRDEILAHQNDYSFIRTIQADPFIVTDTYSAISLGSGYLDGVDSMTFTQTDRPPIEAEMDIEIQTDEHSLRYHVHWVMERQDGIPVYTEFTINNDSYLAYADELADFYEHPYELPE